MSLSKIKLVKLIEECNFLGKSLIRKWLKNLDLIPEEFYSLIYKTFEEVKVEIDHLYAQFELSRDKNGQYSRLINEKYRKIVKLVSRSKLDKAAIE